MLVTVATTSSFPVSLQFNDRKFYLKLWWKITDFCSNILFQLICLLLGRLLLSQIHLQSLQRNLLQVPFAAMLENKSRFTDWKFNIIFGFDTVSPAKFIAITHKVTASWVSKGKTYYRYTTTITNNSSKNLKNLKLYISKLYGPVWGLTKSGNSYSFPSWINTLAPGKSIEFVYIHSASQAEVTVSSYTLGW